MGVAYDLTALSGINGASQGMAVISNNLANAQTFAFKSSRAEFADIFSGAQTNPGRGVRVNAITQDFSQGAVMQTGRELDMAIDGEGFFILEDQSGKYPQLYTRNGSFKVDKDGYLTTQDGNKVLGYLRNDALSTETNPVFDTALNPIDLDELNKTPRATDEMQFDINLDGEATPNLVNGADPNNIAVGDSVGDTDNLKKLIAPKGDSINPGTPNGSYNGFPDFSTNKIVYDSLGGEHRLTANYYKRGVVSSASDLDLDGDANNDKYTSWIVQYTMEDKDPATGEWKTSGWRYDPASADLNGATADSGQVFELIFDTNGKLVRTYMPDYTNVQGPTDSNANGTPDDPLPHTSWVDVTGNPAMQWIVGKWQDTGGDGVYTPGTDTFTPSTGATDPLGNPKATTLEIKLDVSPMTMYSGTYNVRGVTQNGYKVGDLVGLSTGRDGVIEARYSNGRSVPVAKLALANFTDKNALEKLGGQTYAETYQSGPPSMSSPSQNGFGSLVSGAIESSNVDVANELVNLIQTQRMYQASAQVISTSKQLTQTILNL
ncbi:flagellar hook protein FlgE [Sulfurivirga caldicuralii]|uniref:Flagellar hook protein FlgE n=1 Tax=Sulfurivirga caldicuralii TaxID=364032 RepID=A0A1N6E5K9_9GAMM|nr:flagellar hook protein FlgE [Sulfurivirga caldicuralii]SIN78318.1 flagellar hook protein FlgE [Sulfurivirga caldicuralii]